MPSIISQIFSCCLRSRSPTQGEPDEHTHLIPQSASIEMPQPRSYVVDHQKVKDRLGTIVRAKEGKMVNVNTPLPFNLNNKALPETSRSASSSGQRCADEAGSHSREPSPSIQTSRSTSSLHPGDASYLPPSDSSLRRPILNARLVRLGVRRGRSATRMRMGRFCDDLRDENANANGEGAVEEGDLETSAEPEPHKEDVVPAPTPGAAPLPMPQNGDIDDAEETPHASAIGFQIADVGKIAQSWGD